MSIQSEIDRIENNIAATYAELEEQGADMPSARNSTNLAATAATTKTVKYIAQTLTAAEKEQARENIGVYTVSVKDYGAKGNNSTDDTTAFQNALANERVVYVPGGKYKLSGELILGNNCQLELAQDAELYFTQTTGNCISMKASSNIVGNHALIQVPYAFSGRVINIYAGLNESLIEVPPYPHWDPMWKAARYITDLHIVKLNSYGLAVSLDGACSGTAVYLGADHHDSLDYLWAVDLTRIRIAGGFSYGVYLDTSKNPGDPMDGWIHQTRISGFVEGAEVGVYLKDSELSYISMMVLPKLASDNTAYAKWGIYLENSAEVDLSGSRVMDWDANHCLWSEGGIYQHLAFIGNCSGAILNDHFYYSNPGYDIRSLIYTDTPSNLEKLTILQEPFTRWFKPIDNVPYFNDGDFEEKLVLQQEIDEIVDAVRTPNFTNQLATAKDTNGSVFNEIGYAKYGKRINASNGLVIDDQYYGCTGFIPAKAGDTIYAQALAVNGTDSNVNIVLYNASYGRVMHVNSGGIVNNSAYYYCDNYEKTEKGFKLSIANIGSTNDVRYVRFTFTRGDIGVNPIISVNNPITYSTNGYLQDTIKVKSANVEGLSEILGSYIDDVDALLGGG